MYQSIRHKFYADSIQAIMQCVDKISELCKDNGEIMPLWFRGQEYIHYNLEPNIFRGARYKYNNFKTYSNNHLKEDYNYQHFMSRNFDKTDYREPQSMFEWQEIMQHFFFKTRLMDWSESLFVALEFALEAYLIPYRDLEIADKRRKLQPTIWILQPNKLNNVVYDSLISQDGHALYNDIMKNIKPVRRTEIWNELRQRKDIYFCVDNKKMSNIVSLTALEDLRHSYAGRDMEAIKNGEFNPFFFLLMRIYADGFPVDAGSIPPLAIIHPYHSERIKAQRGVFTVSPYYIPGRIENVINDSKIRFNPMAMEFMDKCKEFLYEIQLVNPKMIAEQLRALGYKNSDLYPDTQRVAQDMENSDYKV